MIFKTEDTNNFFNWLSDTRDGISQILSKVTIKENLSDTDESFLEEMYNYHCQGYRTH